MSAKAKLLTLALAMGALATSGCAKDKEESCGAAIANYMSMVDAEQSRQGDPDRLKTARANRPALQNSLLKVCEEQKWSLATRKCLVEAKTAADTKSCVPDGPEPTSSEPSNTAESRQ